MTKPIKRPAIRLIIEVWLAVPTVTLKVEATYTIATFKKTPNVNDKNIPKIKKGRNNWLLRLFSTAG
jgi:hypothetical protein